MTHGEAANVAAALGQKIVERHGISTLRAQDQLVSVRRHRNVLLGQFPSLRPTRAQAGQNPKTPLMAAMAPMAPTAYPIGVGPKWTTAMAPRPAPMTNLTTRSHPGTFLT
jgi:hypothetical protein